MPKLTLLSPENQRWRMFATERATSPLQHPTWLDTLIHAYDLDARIMALVDTDEGVLAALPLVPGKLPWQQRWTSLPFTDTFEPVALNAVCRDELLTTAAQAAGTLPILIRTHVPLPGWSSSQVGTVQIVDLSNGAQGVLRGADAKTRRNVKRAMRAEVGLTTRLITAKGEFLGPSLDLIAQSRRRLGAPTQPRRYWSHVWDLHERDEALTVGVYLDNRLVANGIFIVGGQHAVYKYGASDSETWHLRTNYLMLATAFEHLADRGMRSMDFGITDLRNTSLREFKARWGGEERPAYYSSTSAKLLPKTLEPSQLLSRVIKHTPVFAGRTIGTLAYRFVA